MMILAYWPLRQCRFHLGTTNWVFAVHRWFLEHSRCSRWSEDTYEDFLLHQDAALWSRPRVPYRTDISIWYVLCLDRSKVAVAACGFQTSLIPNPRKVSWGQPVYIWLRYVGVASSSPVESKLCRTVGSPNGPFSHRCPEEPRSVQDLLVNGYLKTTQCFQQAACATWSLCVDF